jgi:large subunit ribosomal protein L24
MKKKFKIKKNDNVMELSGKDAGKTGNVINIITERDRALVSGVNLVKKHTKATQNNQAGIITKEASIHISNIAVVCPKTGVPTKVGFKMLEAGKKVRFAKKSGEILDN